MPFSSDTFNLKKEIEKSSSIKEGKWQAERGKQTSVSSPLRITLHAIKAAALTLLNNSLSSNEGNWKHGIKNITARDRRPNVTFHVPLLWISNINLKMKAPTFSATIVMRWTMSLKTHNNDETSLGPQQSWKIVKESVPTFSHYHQDVKRAHSFQWPWPKLPSSYNLLV